MKQLARALYAIAPGGGAPGARGVRGGERRTAQVRFALPRSVRALADALHAHPHAPDDLRVADGLAARLIEATARFVSAPSALTPAQRALMVMAPTPGAPVEDASGLASALRSSPQTLPEGVGFSRLLEAALQAGDDINTDRLDAEHLDSSLRPLARRLDALARRLSAVDDLSHALSVRSAHTAACVVSHGLCTVTGWFTEADDDAMGAFVSRWLEHRRAPAPIAATFAQRSALDALSRTHVDAAKEAGVSRALALWVLGHRVADAMPLDAQDRPHIDALLADAGLYPLEVFDVAGLWATLDT